MPYQKTWNTWPIVWLLDDQLAYMRGREFMALIGKTPAMRDGFCFGSCVQWIRRFLDHPDEAPIDRISFLATHFGSAVATQLLHREIAEEYGLDARNPRASIDQQFTLAAQDSRLSFTSNYGATRLDTAGEVEQLMAQLQNDGIYLLSLKGEYTKPLNEIVNGFAAAFGPCLGLPPCFSAPGPSPIAHALAIAFAGDGSAKVLDPNFGEFEVGPHEVARFLGEFRRSYKGDGSDFETVYVYEVRQAGASAPARERFGRPGDLGRTTLV